MANNVHYDSTAFEAAHLKYLEDAKSLSDADLEQFAIVDRAFSERARAKRAGFVAAKSAEDNALDKRPATQHDVMWAIKDWIFPLLATYRYKSNETRELIVALETRLSALEQKPYVRFRDVWEPGKSYTAGDAVTYHGGLWICKVATSGEPSKDFVAWKLAVKSRSIT